LSCLCGKPRFHQDKPSILEEKDIIKACRQEDRRAQKLLFDRYSPFFFGILKRYVPRREDAEDVLIDAFYKILTNLDTFKGQGSFEGWMRRIMVNEALMFLRKKHNFNLTVEISDYDVPEPTTTIDRLAADDILSLLDQLPTGYRTVFNLYVVEGFKHREIAELLGVSINTSKSQLILAKRRLRELLERLEYPGLEKTDQGKA